MNVETKLREELLEEIDELSKLQVGSEQYKIAADGVVKITDRLIEMEKNRIDHEAKIRAQDMERDIKIMEIEEERKDRKAKNLITAGSFVSGLGFSYLATKWSFKFEEAGTISSQAGRNFVNKAMNFFRK